MKYYCIGSTIEIKTAVMPCREINTKKLSFLLIVSHFRPFFLLIFVSLLIIFTIFLGHQNQGPDNKLYFDGDIKKIYIFQVHVSERRIAVNRQYENSFTAFALWRCL